jgi:hypothetical protein
MRFCLLFLLLSVLLGACSKTAAPVQVDFIGNTSLISGSRGVNANDTLTSRLYAAGNDHALKRLRISVTYGPGASPFLYPVPLSGYDPSRDAPAEQTLVYLDSLIVPIAGNVANGHSISEYLFQNQFSARSTSGTERWQYTMEDEAGQSTTRAYRLTVRKPDSAAVFHNYSAVTRPMPGSPVAASAAKARARVFLNLRLGLVLPRHAVLNKEGSVLGNQGLVDVVGVTNRAGIALQSPASDSLARKLSSSSWPAANRRRTRLLRTSLTATDFGNARTTADFARAFAAGLAFTQDSLSTGALGKSTVVAFRTGEGYFGLLLVSDIATGTAPLLSYSVKVQK